MESEEVSLRSKCRVTGAENNCPQNSFEESRCKSIHIQVIQKLAGHGKQIRSQFPLHICAQMFGIQ